LGPKLVRSKGLVALIAAAACSKPIARLPQRAINAALEPTVPATVITIRTSLQPQNRAITHSIVIANNRARSDNDLDRWRLFNLEDNTITYVDDLAKTYYTLPFTPGQPGAAVIHTGAKRVLQGVETSQFLIRAGAYQRELWIGAPNNVPQQLFGMMNAEFAQIRGFPLIDHAELPYGKSKLVVDNAVVKIEQKNVPLSLLNVRSEYTGVKAPGESRPPASSPPRGRNTPEAGSRSFSTSQTAP
jgi:hypothetical protein